MKVFTLILKFFFPARIYIFRESCVDLVSLGRDGDLSAMGWFG